MKSKQQKPDVMSTVKNANRSEVARKTGIHISHVSRVFSGKRSASRNNLATLALHFGVTMDELHVVLNRIRQAHLGGKSKGLKRTA